MVSLCIRGAHQGIRWFISDVHTKGSGGVGQTWTTVDVAWRGLGRVNFDVRAKITKTNDHTLADIME